MDRNEAIKIVKSHYPANKQMLNEALECLIPELKESEDEKIRKEIIKYLERTVPHHHRDEVLKSKEWTAWLEKQELKSNPYSGVSFSYNGNIWGMCARDNGVEILFDGELKAFLSSEKSFIYPTRPQPVLEPIKEEKAGNNNKVETKFKVGDWVVSPNGVYWHIDAIQNGRYEVTTDTGQCGNWPLDTNIYRLWTIQDAKDGDVLVDRFSKDNIIILYKGINPKLSVLAYCGWNGYNLSIKTNGLGYGNLDNTNYCPATKEQRDLLFQKMHEAGYEWDVEKKELKKIHIIDEGKAEMDYCFTKMMNGEKVSSAWDEEDEKILKDILVDVKFEGYNNDMLANSYKKINWLKSLKDRVQPKQKLNEYDNYVINKVLDWATFVNPTSSIFEKLPKKQFIESLKSLKQKIGE